MQIGIDATNLRLGGSRTHLARLLANARPDAHGVSSVVVWGSRSTLAILPDRDWLLKAYAAGADSGVIRRTLWQRFSLPGELRRHGCALLFAPGGNVICGFRPYVTMCRNMLPFDSAERRRFGLSLTAARLLVLRRTQARSFARADGVIFLTEHARARVVSQIGSCSGSITVIPHGVVQRLPAAERIGRSAEADRVGRPIRAIYVSIVDEYKHQWRVVEAVHSIRQRYGLPISIDFVGPAYGPALRRLRATIARCDPYGQWARYRGPMAPEGIAEANAAADLAVFASTCENMPNILLEKMAAGLPIVSSDREPMPELLGDAGVYCNPESVASIAESILLLASDPILRDSLATRALQRAAAYRWEDCARDTFAFLAKVAAKCATERGATSPCAD